MRPAAPRSWIIGLLVVGLAAGLRFSYLLWDPPVPNNDELGYARVARSLVEGEGFVRDGVPETHISPLFPAMHALLIPLARDEVRAGVLLALMISSLIPLAGGLVVRRCLGQAEGLVAAGLLCVQPYLVLFSRSIQPDGLTGLLYLCFLLAWLSGRIEVAGWVLGLAYLSRPEAFLLGLAWIGLQFVRREHPAGRVFVAAGLFLATCLPQLAYLRWATGEFGLSGKDSWVYINGMAQVLTRGEPVPLELLERLEREVGPVLPHILSHPFEFLRGYLYRWGILGANLLRLVTWPVAPLVLVGAVRCWRTAGCGRKLLFPLCVLAVLPVGMTHLHHAVTVLPLLVAIAAGGLLSVVRVLRRP